MPAIVYGARQHYSWDCKLGIGLGDSEIIFAIIAAVVGLFVWGRLPVMMVALMVPLALFFTGILPLDQVFSGFGDTVIIFIASLFIVAAGLEAAGVTAWVGQWLSRVVGSSPLKLSLFTLLIVALLSPLISQSGAVAALVPVVILMALRMGQSPSKFLMPLAFASAAGSKLALTGTAKNVLVPTRPPMPAMAISASSNSPGSACRCSWAPC